MLRRLVTSAKFWQVTVEGEFVCINTGAHETPGSTNRIPCASPEAARKTAEALIAQRLRDGFVEQSEEAQRAAPRGLPKELEARLLANELEAWQVFADMLLEAGDQVRGEAVMLQLRAERRVRGAIGQSKAYVKTHFDELVGADLTAFHRQSSIEWHFGYAHTIKVWSGPHSAPIHEVLEAVFNSPSSRFLRRLELGSPGAEGRYGSTLRELAKLKWPTHLDTVLLGAFDLELAKHSGSAWPLLESLSALQPAPQLKALRVRAIFNTFGQKLKFPSLETLWLAPSRLDARLLGDLATLEAPKVSTLCLTEDSPRGTGVRAVAAALSQLIHLGVRVLQVHGMLDVVDVLSTVNPQVLSRLERLDVRESLRTQHGASFLERVGPALQGVTVAVGNQTLFKQLSKSLPQVELLTTPADLTAF